MGIMVSKEDNNTKLTGRINADLRNRASSSSDEYETDFTESSEYLKETARTGRFSWIWVVLVILAIISLIFIVLL